MFETYKETGNVSRAARKLQMSNGLLRYHLIEAGFDVSKPVRRYWTDKELSELRSLFSKRTSLHRMSIALGRTIGDIERQIKKQSRPQQVKKQLRSTSIPVSVMIKTFQKIGPCGFGSPGNPTQLTRAANELGISAGALRYHLVRSGVDVIARSKEIGWSDDETDLLRQSVRESLSLTVIGQRLERSHRDIKAQLKKHKILASISAEKAASPDAIVVEKVDTRGFGPEQVCSTCPCITAQIGRDDGSGPKKMHVGSKKKSVCRVMYELCFGKIPTGQEVEQTCKNHACINPHHFRIGEPVPIPKIAKRYRGHLPPVMVTTIKRLLEHGHSDESVAKLLNLSSYIVTKIRRAA